VPEAGFPVSGTLLAFLSAFSLLRQEKKGESQESLEAFAA
jgi:hypothetical protein